MNQAQAFIHTAYDLKNKFNDLPAETLDSNIISTAKSLKFCKDKGIEQFVFISSCSVYGDSSNSSEGKTKTPINMNGFIKSFNEEFIIDFCTANNINYLILRVFNSYGGNDNFSVVQKLIKCAKEKLVFNLVNDGIAERDFIHIEDVSKIICSLIEKKLTNEIINIGSGESVRICDLVKAIEEKFGNIQLNKTSNANEALYSRANIKKLNTLVNYKPTNIFDFIKKL
jgi:nucleoside-diphosphate-sugar epimerase